MDNQYNHKLNALINEFQGIYVKLHKDYIEKTNKIPEGFEKNRYLRNLNEYLEERHQIYLVYAGEICKELKDKSDSKELKLSFKKIYMTGNGLLSEWIRIANESLKIINKPARKCFIKGLKEEHLLYISKVKALEKELLKGGEKNGSRKFMGKIRTK
ncbi:MAG: hypothetical protein ABRQ25_08970 [Clostridiaceae bacterium]